MVSFAVATAALLSTGAISLAPNVILLLFPHYAAGQGASSKILSLGQAMSAGCLLGDVFLHTLPDHIHSPDCSVWVLIGFTLFLMVDMIIRFLDSHSHDHAHAHHPHPVGSSEINGTSHKQDSAAAPPIVHHSAALLNLAADALHNFTDGLAIGASYAMYDSDKAMTLASILQSHGGLASISIMLHEVPHELGDFCTLVRAGYSKSQAIMAQFMTAIAAFTGTIVALTVSQQGGWVGERLIFCTAGGFVYLAATTLLPEVLDQGESLMYRILQLSFFVVGVLCLYFLAYLEDSEGGHHGGHHHGVHHEGHHNHSEL